MPNWCHNILTVLGPDADVHRMLGQVVDEPAQTSFSLEKIISVPDGAWQSANVLWGCDRDVTCPDPHVASSDSGVTRATWQFPSAWSPPERAVAALAAQYPTVDMTLVYTEPGEGFCGVTRWDAGGSDGTTKVATHSADLAGFHPGWAPWRTHVVDVRDHGPAPQCTSVQLLDLLTASAADDVTGGGALLIGSEAARTSFLGAVGGHLVCQPVPGSDQAWVYPHMSAIVDRLARDEDANIAHTWWQEHCGVGWQFLSTYHQLRAGLAAAADSLPGRTVAERRRLLTLAAALSSNTAPRSAENVQLGTNLATRGECASAMRVLTQCQDVPHRELEAVLAGTLAQPST